MKKFLFSREYCWHRWVAICVIGVIAIIVLLRINFNMIDEAEKNATYYEYVMTYGMDEEYSYSIRSSSVKFDGVQVTYYLDDGSTLYVRSSSAIRKFPKGYIEVYNNVRITTQ